MEEDTEVTPHNSVSWGLKMPLPAPIDSVLPSDCFEVSLGLLDDLEAATLPRITPVSDSSKPARARRLPTEPPPVVPMWALVASSALLFAAVATTVALVF